MWFLNVWICCAIHDYMYRDPRACTRHDKNLADELLLDNLTEWIRANSWPVLKELRMYRATSYYNAVQDGGDSSFWSNGKVKP